MRREHTNFWHTHELGSTVEALTATYFTHTFARHTHEGFAIGIIERGAETFYYRGGTHIAPVGHIVVINPDEIHTGQAVTAQGWSYRMLYPTADFMLRVASEIGVRPHIPYFGSPILYDPVLYQAIRDAHRALESSHSPLERETRLLWAMAHLIRHHADDRPAVSHQGVSHQALQQARDYLHMHYSEPLSLQTLAQVVHLSPFHLSRLFTAYFGLPPHTYLIQIRIQRAKKLLHQGWAIPDVALATGFADQSHLNHAFKRVVGVAPGQYRKIRQDNPDL
ncbi:MAG: AraC family transcriptional regulator [Anaerolineae bacterium]|nr:AraC family transcriptional regulator [Anaerolineae bacterium]